MLFAVAIHYNITDIYRFGAYYSLAILHSIKTEMPQIVKSHLRD